MGFLTVDCCCHWSSTPRPSNLSASIGYFPTTSVNCSLGAIQTVQVHSSNIIKCERRKVNGRAFSSQNSVKKSRNQRKGKKNRNSQPNNPLPDAYDGTAESSLSESGYIQNNNSQTSVTSPSRSVVLQACTVTSGLIAALGIAIRQVSHIASMQGGLINDCSEISFGFEIWHLELITGLVILISSFRYLLLKTWPDFTESSEAANRQVLWSLKPFEYLVVAFLPGASEELLFRGALLPLFGINWKGILIVAALFGILHLGNGRNYSFALWATFVGLVYGCATISSSSIIVPMASHAVNNLVGGIIWRYTSYSSR